MEKPQIQLFIIQIIKHLFHSINKQKKFNVNKRYI